MILRRAIAIANEIRLKRSQHRGSFLLLEGRDDRLFCERYSDPEACKIVVAQNKENVCEAVQILDQDHVTGVVGIVDSDFDRLEGREPQSPNVLLGDAHDLECMLVQSSAFDTVLVEFGSREKIENFNQDVRDALLTAAYPIGVLRLHSERSGLNLRFDGLNYARCINRDTLELECLALIREVKNRSQRFDIPEDQLLEGIRTIEDEMHDHWEICSGTDLLEILSIGLRHILGTNAAGNVRGEHLRRALRLSYGDDCFNRSALKSGLQAWELENGPFRVLR